MKIFLISIMASLVFSSCSSQNKFDLQKMSFKEDIKVVLKDIKKNAELREILTTLPVYVTKEVSFFKFGKIEFSDKTDFLDKALKNSISFFLNDTLSKKLVGVSYQSRSSIESLKLKAYLEKEYGVPQILNKPVFSNNTKTMMGFSNLLWKNFENNKTILLSLSYSELNKKEHIEADMVIMDNSVKDTDIGANRTVVERLIKTFKD